MTRHTTSGMVTGMGLHWHQVLETDDDFLEAAPFRYVTTVDLTVPPEQAWTALAAEDTLVSWSRLVTGVRWTTPRPFGVGTTREVTLLRLITARERYYRWEEDRRMTFAAVQVNVPGLRGLAEDYVVERTPEGSRLIWTLALEPHSTLRPVLRLLNPITAWILRSVALGMLRRVG
jgi:hypothetical protein